MSGVSQLYIRRDSGSRIVLIIAKLTDDILIGGKINAVKEFSALISKRFKISKEVIDSEIRFNGCIISKRSSEDIILSMEDYVKSMKPMNLSKGRKEDVNSPATKSEIADYRRLAGAMN